MKLVLRTLGNRAINDSYLYILYLNYSMNLNFLDNLFVGLLRAIVRLSKEQTD